MDSAYTIFHYCFDIRNDLEHKQKTSLWSLLSYILHYFLIQLHIHCQQLRKWSHARSLELCAFLRKVYVCSILVGVWRGLMFVVGVLLLRRREERFFAPCFHWKPRRGWHTKTRHVLFINYGVMNPNTLDPHRRSNMFRNHISVFTCAWFRYISQQATGYFFDFRQPSCVSTHGLFIFIR